MATPEFAIGNRRNSNVENIMNSSRLAHPDLTARRASSARPSVHDALHPKDSMLRFLEEYLKHFALNFGQALQGLRYIATHPDIDRLAPRVTATRRALIGTAIPPDRRRPVLRADPAALAPHASGARGDDQDPHEAMVPIRLLRLALHRNR